MQVKPVITLMYLILAFCAATLAYAQDSSNQISDLWEDDRYIDHNNGTVTDSQTRLMWKHCSAGRAGDQCTGKPDIMNWEAALEYARDHSGDNHQDWRLPNIKELLSLVAYNKRYPAINEEIFPNTPYQSDNIYWSSSAVATVAGDSIANTNRAWAVNFSEGRVINGNDDSRSISRTTDLMVRLVRDK